jgi:vacuolar-type H+-ATPase subunit C/Vma6
VRVQATIGGTASSTALLGRRAEDMDYLAARLHARRSRMAESERLDVLCRIRSLPEFFRTIYPESGLEEATQFQRLLVRELIDEVNGFLSCLSGRGADLLQWMLVRFQVENLKVLARQCFTRTAIDEAGEHLVPLPGEFALNTQGLAAAKSPEDFVRLVPKGLFRESLERVLKVAGDNLGPFLLEAVLDHTYFQELLKRTDGLPREEKDIVRPMVCQEVDIFHLMLVVRGKFHYLMTTDMLMPLHVAGTMISRGLFVSMLSDLDLDTSVGRVEERVIDGVPFQQGSCDGSSAVDALTLEGLAWRRFLRLSNVAFRKGHIGLGAIAGYVGLRRVEVANLITISEGIRRAMTPETIRAHLIPRLRGEWTHV